MRLRPLLSTLSLGVLLAGCDPDSNGEVPADAVLVTQTMRYLAPDGSEVQRSVAKAADVEVLVPEANGYARLSATEQSPGRVLVRNVPEGDFLLRTGNLYVLTRERMVDTGTYTHGRPEQVSTEATRASFQLSATGLQPWNEAGTPSGYAGTGSEDELYAYAPETGALGLLMPSESLAQGATSLQAVTGEFFSLSGPRIPRLTAGQDTFLVMQLTGRDTTTAAGAPLRYTALRKAGTSPAPTFTGSELLVLNVALQDVSQYSLVLDVRGTELAGHANEVNPGARMNNTSVSLYAAPYGLAHGWVGYAGQLMSHPLREPTDFVATYEYGNPLPGAWATVVDASAVYEVPVTLPSGAQGFLFGTVSVQDTPEHLARSVLRPVVLPPRNLRVDGATVDAAGRTLSGRTPTVSWEAPVQGTPTRYQVTVYALESSGTRITRRRVATVRLPPSARSLVLPEGILAPASHYALSVMADVGPGVLPPEEFPIPAAQAEALTGRLSTP